MKKQLLLLFISLGAGLPTHILASEYENCLQNDDELPPLMPVAYDAYQEANEEDFTQLVECFYYFVDHCDPDPEYPKDVKKRDFEEIFEATWKAIRMDKKTTLSNLLDAYEDLTDWIRLDNQFLIYQAASSRPRLVLQTPHPEYLAISRKSCEAVRAAKMQIQQHLSPNRYIANRSL